MSSWLDRVRVFSGEEKPRRCRHKHQLQNTGGVFYQSMQLIQCARCGGWQAVRKPIA